MDSIVRAWVQLVSDHWKVAGNVNLHQITMTGYWSRIPFVLRDIGYTESKMTKLTNTYVVPGSFDKFKRHFGSTVRGCSYVPFGNRAKVGDGKDFCLIGMAIPKEGSQIKGVDIYYRNAELAAKFAADLVFIQRVFDELGISEDLERKLCRIHFSAAYLTRCHFPIFYVMCKKMFNVEPLKGIVWAEEFMRRVDKGEMKISYTALRRAVRLYNNLGEEWRNEKEN